jgi:lipoate-protein ligase B
MTLWQDLGRVSYPAALAIQERVADERRRGLRPDTLLLLEHPPTVTLGRRADETDLVADAAALAHAGVAVERVGRGGRATYHGPGQLVGYPIVRLSSGGRGVRRFVAALEDILLSAIASFGVGAERRVGHPGAWLGGGAAGGRIRKIASIGIEVRGGVSRHGFALNVDMDLEPFAAIVPCGVPGLELTDLAREAGARVDFAAAKTAIVRAWRATVGPIEEESLHGIEGVG